MLVQTVDDILGDVEALGSIEDVVALLGQNHVILLVLVIGVQEVLQRVAQSSVVFLGLRSQFTLQTSLKLLQALLLTLDGSLLALGLLAAGETIVLQLLLEGLHSLLQGLSLGVERIAGVGALLFQDEGELLAEFILGHQRIYFHIGQLHATVVGFSAGSRLLIHLWTFVVASSQCHHGGGHQ